MERQAEVAQTMGLEGTPSQSQPVLVFFSFFAFVVTATE